MTKKAREDDKNLDGFEEFAEDTSAEDVDEKYHLSVTNIEWTIVDDKFSDLDELIPNQDAVSGLKNQMLLEIRNIGDEIFPGGELIEFRIEEKNGPLSAITKKFTGDSLEIEELEPGESKEMIIDETQFYSSCVSNVKFSIETDDGTLVTLYQGDGNSSHEDEIFYPFSVVDREKIRMVQRMGEISEKIGEEQ